MTLSLKRGLFLIYYLIFWLPATLFLTFLCAICTGIGSILGFASWAGLYPGMWWSRLVLWISFCPVEIRGKEHLPTKGQTYVVAANHQSMYDIFVLYAYIGLPFKWVLKQSLRKVPFVGWACEKAGFVYVDDTKRSGITQTITQAQTALSNGFSIFIFPEGSRTLTGKMTRFKKGAFAMASQLNVPILPMSIDGAYDVLRAGGRIPHPRKIILTIHPPVHLEELGTPPNNIILAAKETQRRIASALPNEDMSKYE